MQCIGIALLSYLIGHTPYQDLLALSQLAEEKGFDAVVFPDLVNDALACAEAVALSTNRIKVGTFIANVRLRHPVLTAATAVGVRQAMARGDHQGAIACISDRMLDALLPIGPAERCREHIAAFCEAGVALPIVMPYPSGEDYSSAVRRMLNALAPQ